MVNDEDIMICLHLDWLMNQELWKAVGFNLPEKDLLTLGGFAKPKMPLKPGNYGETILGFYGVLYP